MEKETKIRGFCNLDNKIHPCRGFITILDRDEWTIGIVWQMFLEDGTSIAGEYGRKFYVGKNPVSDEQIIEKAIAGIEKYRMSRKHIFFDVKIVET